MHTLYSFQPRVLILNSSNTTSLRHGLTTCFQKTLALSLLCITKLSLTCHWKVRFLFIAGTIIITTIVILSNRPIFSETVLIFGSNFLVSCLFFTLSHFLLYFCALFLDNFSYFRRILKDVPLLDQKSCFFRDFVPYFVL